MENKSFTIDVKQISEEGDYFTFSGYGSIFGNVDLDNDIISKGAFSDSLKTRTPKLLYQHNSQDPIGRIEATEDKVGLMMTAYMPRALEKAQEVYTLLKANIIEGLSIGYRVVDFEIKEGIRIISKVDLFEVSVVTFPCNQLATVTDVKSVIPYQDLPLAELSHEWDSKEAMARVCDFTNSKEAPSQLYSKAFMFCNKEDKSLESYKFPIADVIDGVLTAVPKGVMSAAVALRGSRGRMSEEEQKGITSNLNRYFEKMGIDSPLEKGFSSHIEGLKSIPELSSFLKDYGFSNKESTKLIKGIKDARKESSQEARNDALTEINQQLEAINQLIED